MRQDLPKTRSFKIALLPGDGIGREVIAEACKVLHRVEQKVNTIEFQTREYAVGAAEYLRNGAPLSEEVFAACEESDAVLLGAMGLPEVRWPDGKEMTPQIDLRERLDTYSGLRPIRLYHEQDTPLKGRKAGAIDLLLVRESTEGLFSARLSKQNRAAEEVRDVLRITRKGSERIFRAAFDQAMKRRRQITLVDKANVLPSMVYFRSIFDEIAREYPDVRTEKIYVDAAALYMMQRPECFDVIVTENMFGDILSDLAAGLVGGMGMAPSADVGDRFAVFQPAHGSAPDIAGQEKANPVAAILSVAMMLEWFGMDESIKGAAWIRQSVETVLADPSNRTPDLGGKLTTSQLGDRIASQI
jgi:3-isopropylmalate dehydrogenase